METLNQISQFELFNGIHSTTMNQILEIGKIIELKKGSLVMRARESVGFIMIQLSGKSIGYNLTYNGKRKILFVFGKGSLLNGYVFDNITSSIYCETIEPSKILMISVNDFSSLMAKDFELTKNVIFTQEKKIWKLRHHLKNEGSGIPIEKKLIAKLLKLSRDFGFDTREGKEIDMDLSITFLGDMIGAPRETTSRACSHLVKEGYIRINKKRITILDQEKLTSLYKMDKKYNTD